MRYAMIALAASLAFGQTSKVFQLTQHENPGDLQEIATMLRATADIRQISIDDTIRTLTVDGTDAQIAMADWLVRQIDVPASGPFSRVYEYRPPAGGDDVARVFYASQAPTPQALQEIAVVLRSVADIRRISVYNALRALAVRGTNQQVLLAAWLMDQLNQAAGVAAPQPHEYQLSGGDVARVFELTNPQTPQQFQEIVTLIRTIGDVQRLFVYYPRRAVALRATAERVALAAWLVSELDKPANQPGAADRGLPHEYRQLSGPNNLVRIFYPAGAQSEEDLQKMATEVRETAQVPRVFVYHPLGALAVRGTVGQVAAAEKVIAEMKAP